MFGGATGNISMTLYLKISHAYYSKSLEIYAVNIVE
jgi:hypothetical protein